MYNVFTPWCYILVLGCNRSGGAREKPAGDGEKQDRTEINGAHIFANFRIFSHIDSLMASSFPKVSNDVIKLRTIDALV